MTTSAEVIAELVRKHRAGTALWIDHPVGGTRVIAEILPTDTGFVFADIGWAHIDNFGHPFHRVDGIAHGVGSVLIDLDGGGQAEVFEFGDPYDSPGMVSDLARWRAWLASPEAKNYGGAERMLRLVKDDVAPDARLW